MAIEVVPHSREYTPSVESFNLRMREGGSQWGFYPDPEPDWIPHSAGARAWREYHLALEDGKTVRGGYALKPQQWLINGEIAWVTDWQGPFTEAEVNAKYSPLMLRLARSAQKQYPLLFSLGHSKKDADVLCKMGWGVQGLPFCFQVIRPFQFLRKNQYLRTTWARRLVLDFLAYTYAGALALNITTWWRRLPERKLQISARAEVVETFGDWADELWEKHKGNYSCLAIRDREMMNALLPENGWPAGATRLKIVAAGRVIGWSVVFEKQMVDDSRFGSMKVGLVADFFGDPEQALEVLHATHQYLRTCDVDLICSNLSHPKWIGAFEDLGYFNLKDRRIFAFSSALKQMIEPIDKTAEGLHLTNMDGHGPHGFTAN